MSARERTRQEGLVGTLTGDEVAAAAMMRLRRAVLMTPAGPIEIIAGQKVSVGFARE